jgi:hypothetical protein
VLSLLALLVQKYLLYWYKGKEEQVEEDVEEVKEEVEEEEA